MTQQPGRLLGCRSISLKQVDAEVLILYDAAKKLCCSCHVCCPAADHNMLRTAVWQVLGLWCRCGSVWAACGLLWCRLRRQPLRHELAQGAQAS